MTEHHVHNGNGSCGAPGHDHHHIDPASDGARLGIAFVIIATFMVVEIIGGLISGSLALLADAGHMATDAAALLLAISARWLASRNARSDIFPFGLRRAQVLAGFLNALALIVLTGWLIYEAVVRFFEPNEILSGYMLIVAIAGLVANLAAFAVLHGGNKSDLNLRGALLHVIGDIFGSVAAIGSALVIMATGFVRIDPILTLLVSGLILRYAWPLLSEASHILLQGAPSNLDTDDIVSTLETHVPGIREIHQLKVWMLTPEEPQLAMHLAVDDPALAPDILKQVKTILNDRFSIAQSTIQIECDGCPDLMNSAEAEAAAESQAPGVIDDGDEDVHPAPTPVMRAG